MKKLLLIAGMLLGLASLGHGEDFSVQPVGPFGTLNDTDNSMTIPANMAQSLLNVDISPNGKSIKKRKGYGVAHTLQVSTVAVHGVYDFYDANGNEISLYFNDRYMSASTNGNAPTVLFSTGSNGATYQCVDSQGFAYCLNTGRTSLIKTNGATFSLLTNVNSTGTMVAVTPERLVMSGFAEAPNRIDFSKGSDFTTWTVGSQPTDPITFTITAPGSRITHITYAFNRIIWFKDSSFGFILSGPTQSDWVVKIVSPNIGTLDNTSVYRDGLLYFRGQDSHLYTFDGTSIQKISRDIATTIGTMQSRQAAGWTQTSAEDWAASSTTPAGYLDIASPPGAVILTSSASAVISTDTTQSDFQAGTFTTVDSTSSAGSLRLAILGPLVKNWQTSSTQKQYINRSLGSAAYQQFETTSTFFMSRATLSLSKIGSPNDLIVSVQSDNGSNRPGSVLQTGTILASSVSTSQSDVTVIFTSTIVITSGTKYWITTSLSSADDNNTMFWHYDTGAFGWFAASATFNGTIGQNQASYGTSMAYKYAVLGSTFSPSGNFTSRSFDVGVTTTQWIFGWDDFSPSGTDGNGTGLTYYTQSSADNSSWDARVALSSGNPPGSVVRRYIRYQIDFVTTLPTSTPQFDSAVVRRTVMRRPNGTLYSQVKNATNLTAWDTFGVTKADNNGSQTFYMRSATNSFTITSATPSWTLTTVSALPTISTGTYFQVRDDFSVTAATQNPTLNDFTVNWFEGYAADKCYATYHDDAIWWTVTSGAGNTANNKVLRWDLLNNGFTIYDIGTNGFFIRSLGLYFGSPTAGYIYKFGDATSDNGAAINAYWKSKDFFMDDPFTDKDFVNLSVTGKSVANSTMTVTYTVNGSSSVAYTMALYTSSSAFVKNARNLPLGTYGNTLNLQFGNNAADQPFEVFGGQIGYRRRTWIPTP